MFLIEDPQNAHGGVRYEASSREEQRVDLQSPVELLYQQAADGRF
jgi:hypothetical protein